MTSEKKALATLTNESEANDERMWQQFERDNVKKSQQIGRFIAKMEAEISKPELDINYIELKESAIAEMKELALRFSMLKELIPHDSLWYRDLAGDWYTVEEEKMEEFKEEFEYYKPLYENLTLNELGKTGWRPGCCVIATSKALAYLSCAYYIRSEVKQLVINLKGINNAWKVYI